MQHEITRRRFLGAMAGGAALVAGAAAGRLPVAAQDNPPQPAAPEPPLLRMLAAMPDRPDLAAGGVTFADLGTAKRLYGFADIRSPGDLRRISATAFSNALSGCYTSGRERDFALREDYRDLFGYDFFAIDREIAIGQVPNLLPRCEGVFDPDEIGRKLRDGGYMPVDYRGTEYLTKGGDSQIGPLSDPRTRLALARLNRVAADRGRLLTAGATAAMELALDAEAGRVPTLAANPAFRALALALRDVTSMATLDERSLSAIDPAAVLAGSPTQAAATIEAQMRALRERTPLRPALLVALGYTDKGNDERVLHAARVYANPDDARADAPELERRIAGYTLTRTNRLFIPEFAESVATRAEEHEGRGVLVADIPLVRTPVSARLWLQMYSTRDTAFLVP